MLATAAPEVSFQSLLREMGDRDALAIFPKSPYHSLQAGSCNRLSTARDLPNQGAGGSPTATASASSAPFSLISAPAARITTAGPAA